MITLVENWKELIGRSYTAWAFYVLATVTLAPDALYVLTGIDTNPALWSILQIWVIALGLFGRLVLQPRGPAALWRRWAVAGIVAATLMVAFQVAAQSSAQATMRVLVPLVIKWEGEHRCSDAPHLHCAYLDIVGVPTLCYGETRDVRLGDRATDRACRDMLEQRLAHDFHKGLHQYFTETTRDRRLTPQRDAAYVSLAYNVGLRGAGRSTATRRLNAGDIAGGCAALAWWNRAGGRVVRGLVHRRAEEVALCRQGLRG